MICPHCQKAIRDGAAFCKYCGARVTMASPPPMIQPSCSRCRRPLTPDAAFCKYCGQPCSPVQDAVPVHRSPYVPDEAPVKVKRYGFLRFLLVLMMLFLLWQCLKIPGRIREARTGRVDSISLLPRLPFLPEQKNVQENAFGTGDGGAPVSEFEKLAPEPRPAAFDASHDALVQGMYGDLPAVPEDDGEDAEPEDRYDEEVTGQ